MSVFLPFFFFFFFNDTATTEIYTLSLHDALPISWFTPTPRYAVFASFWKMRISVDRKSTRLNSSHGSISYAVFCLKKKKNKLNARLPLIPPKFRFWGSRLRFAWLSAVAQVARVRRAWPQKLFLIVCRPPLISTLIPYTTLFR